MLFNSPQAIRQLTRNWHLRERRRETHFLVWFPMLKSSLHSHCRNYHQDTLERYDKDKDKNAAYAALTSWFNVFIPVFIYIFEFCQFLQINTKITSELHADAQGFLQKYLQEAGVSLGWTRSPAVPHLIWNQEKEKNTRKG